MEELLLTNRAAREIWPSTLFRGELLALSATEASVVLGVPRKTIDQVIDRREVQVLQFRGRTKVRGSRAVAPTADQRRRFGVGELVYLAFRQSTLEVLTAGARKCVYRELATWESTRESLERISGRDIAVGAGIDVDLTPAIARVQDGLRRLLAARDWVVSDPDVLGGEPVARGTRIPVSLIAQLAAQGAPDEELLGDYPSLTREMLDAAKLYAAAYPRAGRPATPPWRNAAAGKRTRRLGK